MNETKRTILRVVSVLCFLAVAASLGYSRGRLSASRECVKEQAEFGSWCSGEIDKWSKMHKDMMDTTAAFRSECLKTASRATECAVYLSKSMDAEERCWDEAERCQAARR